MKARLSEARRVAFRNDLYYYFESLAREAGHSVSRSQYLMSGTRTPTCAPNHHRSRRDEALI